MISNFKQIGQYQYSSEALIFKGKLESEGLEVFMWDNNTVDIDPLISNAIGGVKLFVREDDQKKAEQILSEISAFSLDDKGSLIKCANCGAEKVQLLTTVKDLKSLVSFLFSSFLFGSLPIYNKYKYKCDVCKVEF
ncbi:MAG TPA: hypothetical protein VFM79_09140 [Pelobium sp.]|nr:hypothetical protein [Pelobium sp.]